MNLLDSSWHALGFVAPAVALALALAAAGRLMFPGRGRWWVHALLHSLAGTAVLLLGLWHFGVDGKMATYATLVAVAATSQWLFSKAWR